VLDERRPPQAAHPRRETVVKIRRIKQKAGPLEGAGFEREKGFEPSTSTLASEPGALIEGENSVDSSELGEASGRGKTWADEGQGHKSGGR
jgi:hypothetical protein